VCGDLVTILSENANKMTYIGPDLGERNVEGPLRPISFSHPASQTVASVSGECTFRKPATFHRNCEATIYRKCTFYVQLPAVAIYGWRI
jgi:hypothetical protein